MSTDREFVDTSIIRKIFPETKWDELLSSELNQVFQRLREAGSLGAKVVDFIQTKKVKLGSFEQYKSGAGWTLLRNITLAPDVDLETPYALSLIVHEALHLEQSILLRLSVHGELLAWQHQERAYFEITKERIGESGQAYGGKRKYWAELMQLSPDSRTDLERAQELMRAISPDYRSYCLPLYPLHQEIWYWLRQGKFKDASGAVKNLISCE